MPREITLFILVAFGSIVLYVQPGLTQTAEDPTGRESCTESNGQQPTVADDFSLDLDNCPDYTSIRLFQIDGDKTEDLPPTHPEECKMNTTCWEFELSCTNGTSYKCDQFPIQVGMNYYLGWMKLKVNASEKNTNRSNCDYLDRFWNSRSWFTAALNISDANVHVLCLNSTFGISQYPILHFIFGLNQNYSLDWFHQALWNFTGTNEYLCDAEVGGKILYLCDEQSESVPMHYERQKTWRSNADTEVIQTTVSLKNVINELTLTPSETSRENHSVTSTWADNSTVNPNWDTQSVSQLEERRVTTVPTESPELREMTTDTAASSNTKATFSAFRGSLSITNWTSCRELINETSINYRKLENVLMAQLPQLLTEAAEVMLNHTLRFTVVLEEFRKDSLIVNLILLTHLVENMTLASMNSVLKSAVDQLQRFQDCLLMLHGNIEDFIPCEKNICVYNCYATDGMNKCTCLNGLNGDRLTCVSNDTSSCGGTQVVIPGPLALDLEKMAQFLDFANNTGCSFNRSTADTSGILHVRDLCLNITDVINLWLDWKNKEVLHLVLEGPNITVCQFSVSPKEQMIFKLIDRVDGFKGSFLVGYTQLHKEQSHAFEKFESLRGILMHHRKSLAVYANESLIVNVSIQTRLASNPKLFLKSCEVVSVSQDSERTKLIEDGCPTVNGLSSFHNGNSSFVLLSVNSSISKNFTLFICKLQICSEKHCGCTRNKLEKIFVPNSNSLQENYFEIGPIIVMERMAEDESKKDEPSMMVVILITVGAILLVIMIIGFLRFMYRRISDATYAARVLKKRNIFRRQSSMDPVNLMSWKQL